MENPIGKKRKVKQSICEAGQKGCWRAWEVTDSRCLAQLSLCASRKCRSTSGSSGLLWGFFFLWSVWFLPVCCASHHKGSSWRRMPLAPPCPQQQTPASVPVPVQGLADPGGTPTTAPLKHELQQLLLLQVSMTPIIYSSRDVFIHPLFICICFTTVIMIS